MIQPLVSVIIPTFNRGEILSYTLDSVRNQTYKNWECLIIDDNSYDYTEELLQFYSSDSRFKYFKLPVSEVKGANSCRNFGFQKSKGIYIQWLDSDDLLTAEKLEAQINMVVQTDADLCTCKWGRFYIPEKLQIESNLKSYCNFDEPFSFFEALSFSKGYFPIHAYLMKSVLVEKAGLWGNLKVNQDGEFMSRIILNSKKIRYVDKGMALYRFYNGTSSYENKDKVNELIKSWKIIARRLKKSFPLKKSNYLTKAKSQVLLVLRNHKSLAFKNLMFFRDVEKYSLKTFLKSFFY